jgi:hypothetical protein
VLVLVVVLDLLAGRKRREHDDENETLNSARSFALASAVAGRSLKAGRSFLETRKTQTNLISP